MCTIGQAIGRSQRHRVSGEPTPNARCPHDYLPQAAQGSSRGKHDMGVIAHNTLTTHTCHTARRTTSAYLCISRRRASEQIACTTLHSRLASTLVSHITSTTTTTRADTHACSHNTTSKVNTLYVHYRTSHRQITKPPRVRGAHTKRSLSPRLSATSCTE